MKLLALLLSFSVVAHAQTTAAPAADSSPSNGLFIKISEAGVKKSLIAIPSFQFVGSPGAKGGVTTGKTLFDTFRNDMDVSGLFDIQKPDALPKDAATSGLKPAPGEAGGFTYDYYKQIGTEFLVRVGYRTTGDQMSVDAYLYYVPQAKQILAKTYRASAGDARTVAHTFANDVIKALTGQPGSFLSKIVVSRSTAPGQKEIFVMDWDGANAKTSHSPRNNLAVASMGLGRSHDRLQFVRLSRECENEKPRSLHLRYRFRKTLRDLLPYRRELGRRLLP